MRIYNVSDMEKHRLLLLTGQLSFTLGIISTLVNALLFKDSSILAFLSGAFLGLSIPLNLNNLRISRYRKDN